MEQPVLKLENLSVEITSKEGTFPVVDGVSFAVKQGETLGVVGESGCGKSMTSMAILRLISPKIGRIGAGSKIEFMGRDLLSYDKKQMCAIRGNEMAMIFQDSMTSLNPVLTIERQMVETLLAHRKLSKKEARERCVEMLAKVGIPSPEARIKSYPHQLSGGMRQRVVIATALLCGPKLLIADEPTTALDVTIQAQILELMKKLKEEMDTSIILITHDMGVVADMADNIMVMYAGKVMEYGTAEHIFKHPLHPYTKGLLASIPRLDKDVERLHSIEGRVSNPSERKRGCLFCPRCEYAQDRCAQEQPAFTRMDGRSVSCWLYAGQGKEGI